MDVIRQGSTGQAGPKRRRRMLQRQSKSGGQLVEWIPVEGPASYTLTPPGPSQVIRWELQPHPAGNES